MEVCRLKEIVKNCPISNLPCPGECIYSDVLNNINVGIIVFDIANEMIVFQNSTCIALLQDFVSPKDYHALSRMLLDDKRFMETEQRSLSLRNRVLGYTVYNITEGYLWVFIRDITEKIKTEKSAVNANLMTRAILENSPYGIFVVSGRGTIEYVNPTMLRISARSHEEFFNLNIYEIPSYVKLGITELIRTTLEAGEPFFVGPVEYTSLRGKTTIRNFQGMQLIDDTGGKALVFVEDITEQKRIELQNALLAATVESSTEAIVITDAEAVIQYVNPAFEHITGYTKEEVIGKNPRILKSGRHDEAYYKLLWDTLRGGDVWQGKFFNKKKGGDLYEEDATIYPVKSASGKVLNYVAVKRDVTEKSRLESIAEAVNTMNNIGYIFSGIRHEIGNPINSTKMALSVLKKNIDSYSHDMVREYIDRAMIELSRVEYLLKSLKSFNMFESPTIEKVDVHVFMDALFSLIKGDFEKDGVAIKLILHPEADIMMVDPRALQQVMLNILTNAIDALEGCQEPKVIISIFKMSGFILISILDNGIGIGPEQQSNLFKPFYTTKEKGTGLGLVIVKKMLSRMNCTLDITSQKDAGTIIDIYIPEAAHEAERN